jgi:hypothetical protein
MLKKDGANISLAKLKFWKRRQNAALPNKPRAFIPLHGALLDMQCWRIEKILVDVAEWFGVECPPKKP